MKKVLIALLLIIGLGASAQSKLVNLKSTTTGKVIDTLNNTTARTQRLPIAGTTAIMTFQPTFTRISGTAAGTAVLQGSVDGVGYTAIGSAFTLTNVVSQTASFSVNPSIYNYYQIVFTPSGTQSTAVTTPVLIRVK